NVAIAARYLVSRHNLKRVLIVDWDCHHGNGTQEIFYGDNRVLYVSLHRWPFYPGTGGEDEKGSGKGKGFTINIPLEGDTPRDMYIETFDKMMAGDVRSFDPEFVIISAGFDAYADDPIAGLGLEPDDFATLTRITMELANRCCNGRILSCLEGGYSLQALPLCVEQHLTTLLQATQA
ncbi:MAG: histone deacetylase, partial [Candidatus Brocadiales bacterium]|nr:histone deacetylase [Candidatus Bathyanammoxibius sp.]